MLKYLRIAALRIAVTVLSLGGWMLLITLWLRISSWRDNVYVYFCSDKFANFASEEGWCAFVLGDWGTNDSAIRVDSWPLRKQSVIKFFPFNSEAPTWKGFEAYWIGAMDCGVVAPHWFAVSLFAIVSAAPWVRWVKHFSLRALLIATTLVAAVLGLIAVLP